LQPFTAKAVFKRGKAGGVAARLREAIDKACADRVSDQREHDWHAAGRLQQRCYGACARRHNNVRCKHGQLCRVFAELVGVAHPPPIFDLEVVPDRPAQTLKLLHKGHNARCASMSSADRFISMPTRRTLLFWARDASGHAAAPPTNVMNSRRFIAPPKLG